MTTEDESDESCDIKYQLDCGRWVTVDECYIGESTLGILAGGEEIIRRRVIERLPERVQGQFGHVDPYYIKPVPEGESLPNFVFMVPLVSDLIDTESRDHHSSHLIVCWLSDDITTSLPELIKREARAIEWNKYAVDFSY
jgi:hypothetical protein